MLGFAQNWFSAKPNPIGIDFGTDTLRLAQVQTTGPTHALFAAGCCEVPDFAKVDHESRLDFFEQAVRDLLSRGKFKGRSAVLALPASLMFVHRLRLPRMSDADLKEAAAVECKGKIPIDPDAALLRHVVTGSVRVFGQPMLDVIVLASPKDAINKYLAAAARAKLNVVGMKIEPMAVLDCFREVHRRKIDADSVTLYVDLGVTGTRVVVAQGTHLFGLSTLDIGGRAFDHAVATAMEVSTDDARLLRLKHSTAQTSALARDIRNVSPRPALEAQTLRVSHALCATTARLAAAIQDCRTRHDATFPRRKVERVMFLGGEASSHKLCMDIAEAIGLPAQIGDPLVRMGRTSEIPIESGIDRRLPQPAWAVAIGLSFEASPVAFDEHPASHATAEAA